MQNPCKAGCGRLHLPSQHSYWEVDTERWPEAHRLVRDPVSNKMEHIHIQRWGEKRAGVKEIETERETHKER